MKYKIVITKLDNYLYLGFCPIIPGIQAQGDTADDVLKKIQQELLCSLHDPKAEFEIVFGGRGADTRHDSAGGVL